jgi:hypothetical protein
MKYPIEEMFEGRTLFEKIMGEYHYKKAEGWAVMYQICWFKHKGNVSDLLVSE